MKLENVVPWGRNRSEYQKMFLLEEGDYSKNILGCGDGPSSFNAEGEGITSIDPIYNFSKDEIRKRINETKDIIKEQMLQNQNDFIWKEFKDVEDLCKSRLESMNNFLEDYDIGKKENRYIPGSLPILPFEDNEFDLALSSHFLFLYSEDLNLNFHIKSIKEMLRVSKEVRIFPLVNLTCDESPHLKGVLEFLDENQYTYKIEETRYEFQKGANRMLRIY